MDASAIDCQFSGSVPEVYDTLVVPMLFEPYAADLARRIAARAPRRVLEVAAGTGVVTRALDGVLKAATSIVATDLNQAMVDRAMARGTRRAVAWRQADAQDLPFNDGIFDAVVCQCGAMFFPDRVAAFGEARRVLARGGAFVFSVWDRIEHNEFAATVTEALATVFPADPPRFLARTPHGYHDPDVIRRDLAAAGFTEAPQITVVSALSRAESSEVAAMALCQGSPLRAEIEARSATGLASATAVAAAALTRRFGAGSIEGRTQALLVQCGG